MIRKLLRSQTTEFHQMQNVTCQTFTINARKNIIVDMQAYSLFLLHCIYKDTILRSARQGATDRRLRSRRKPSSRCSIMTQGVHRDHWDRCLMPIVRGIGDRVAVGRASATADGVPSRRGAWFRADRDPTDFLIPNPQKCVLFQFWG